MNRRQRKKIDKEFTKKLKNNRAKKLVKEFEGVLEQMVDHAIETGDLKSGK